MLHLPGNAPLNVNDRVYILASRSRPDYIGLAGTIIKIWWREDLPMPTWYTILDLDLQCGRFGIPAAFLDKSPPPDDTIRRPLKGRGKGVCVDFPFRDKLREVQAAEFDFNLPKLEPRFIDEADVLIPFFTAKQTQLMALLLGTIMDLLDQVTQGYLPTAVVLGDAHISLLIKWDPDNPGTPHLPPTHGVTRLEFGPDDWISTLMGPGEVRSMKEELGSFNIILDSGFLWGPTTSPTWLPIQGGSHDGVVLDWWNTELADGSVGPIFTELPTSRFPIQVYATVLQMPRRSVQFLWNGDWETSLYAIRGFQYQQPLSRKWAAGVLRPSARAPN